MIKANDLIRHPSSINLGIGLPGSAGAVLIVTPWYGGTGGGVAVNTETLAGALTRASIDVVVVLLQGTPGHPTGIGRFSEPIIPIVAYGQEVYARGIKGIVGYHLRAALAHRTLQRIIHEHGIRIAHLHYAVPAYRPIIDSLNRLGIPTVLTFRGSDAHQVVTGSGPYHEINRIAERASYITAVSDGLLDTVLDRFPVTRGRACAIPNSAPLDIWDALDLNEQAPARDIDILFVGNLRWVKGPDILLDSFQRVLSIRPTCRLYFVGSGDMEAQLRATAKDAGITDKMVFYGRAQRDEISNIYRRSRILAVPSRDEGFSLVAVEAQLNGTPVIGTNVGGIPQAVRHGHTGMLVRAEDPGAMADAILTLLSDEEQWRQLSTNACSWARDTFSPDTLTSRYLELYHRLIHP